MHSPFSQKDMERLKGKKIKRVKEKWVKALLEMSVGLALLAVPIATKITVVLSIPSGIIGTGLILMSLYQIVNTSAILYSYRKARHYYLKNSHFYTESEKKEIHKYFNMEGCVLCDVKTPQKTS